MTMEDSGMQGTTAGRGDHRRGTSRRSFLAAAGVTCTGALAGCPSLVPSSDGDVGVSMADFRGSGPLVEQRSEPGGERIEDLPDLSGELRIYLGGGESGLYRNLISLFEEMYPDFSAPVKFESTRNLVNAIIEEHEAGNPQADVFIAVDAGSLGAVAEAGAAKNNPSALVDDVPSAYRHPNGQWVGIAGRARAIPYNTEQFDASEIPDGVSELAELARFEDAIGWAPSYSAFQSFVTAMRLTQGDEETKAWLREMLDQGVTTHDDEFNVSNRVADGELGAGFANHYYAMRVKASRENAPIDLAFTQNDAGALVNVSGAQIVGGSETNELAGNFIDHLLSAEAQEFFATRTFAYPTIPDVSPVGDLPSIDELQPPDVDLTELSDVGGTLDLLREVNVL